MQTVTPQEDHPMTYPEVIPGATDWAHSDTKPKEETITVTAHGLRRLLRAARMAQGVVVLSMLRGSKEYDELEKVYAEYNTRERLVDLSGELSAIWCEDDLVMSRLFVTSTGQACAHPNKEVDDASIPPWERAEKQKQGGNGDG